MELFEEILLHLLETKKLPSPSPDLQGALEKVIDLQAYETLKKIKAVLEDDSLDDRACFQKIEQIVCLFEALGSGCGNRHDFG